MLSSVLRAPLTFFEMTPAGRILNRFSRDIETVDTLLPELIDQWLGSAFDVLATVVILLYSTPIFLALVIPLAVFYYFAQVLVFRSDTMSDYNTGWPTALKVLENTCSILCRRFSSNASLLNPVHLRCTIVS